MWTQPKREQLCNVQYILNKDMDYDGFRQMVLGANIFPTKSKQLTSFTKGENLPALALRIDETNIEQERVAKKTQ